MPIDHAAFFSALNFVQRAAPWAAQTQARIWGKYRAMIGANQIAARGVKDFIGLQI
jgi:hypothetical protein